MTFPEELERAADDWERVTEAHGYFADPFSFKCGAKWAVFESELVKGLVETLAFYAGLIEHAEQIGLGEPNREMGLMPAKFGIRLLETLAAFEKTRGNK